MFFDWLGSQFLRAFLLCICICLLNFFLFPIRLLHLWNHTFYPYIMNLFNVFQLKFCHMDFTTFFVYTCLTYWLTLRETEKFKIKGIHISWIFLRFNLQQLEFAGYNWNWLWSVKQGQEFMKEREAAGKLSSKEKRGTKHLGAPSGRTDAQSPQPVTAGVTQSQSFSVSLLLWSRIKFQGATVLLA